MMDPFPQLREETITWDVNYSSAFFLMAEKTSVEGQEELLVFDFEDLINGIGGALGLFLGWSILNIGKCFFLLSFVINHIQYLSVRESSRIARSFSPSSKRKS